MAHKPFAVILCNFNDVPALSLPASFFTTCGWRIRSMTQLARAAQSCTGWRSWYCSPHARIPNSRHSLPRHLREAAPPGEVRAVRRRIPDAQNFAPDNVRRISPQSIASCSV
jgi:hypothetical protein